MSRSQIWAPWRITYIQGLSQPTQPDEADSCFLCAAAAAQDPLTRRQRLVLMQDERGMMMLNRYPYTNGHLLIAPASHLADLSDLSIEQRNGMMELAELGCRLLRKAMVPQGLNVGVNLGRCAGAGLPGHVHMHVVPRWSGDVNFMDSVGNVRVIPQALEDTLQLLTDTLAKL